MQRLCAPDRVLWFIEHGNEGQLEVKKRYGLKSVVVCNLRQLLGWSKVGTPKGGRHDRDKRKEVANFQIVFAAEKLASTETVQWLQHVTGGEVVPLVGKLQHKLDTVARKHPNIVPGAMAKGSLKNLLNDSVKDVRGELFHRRVRFSYSATVRACLASMCARRALTLSRLALLLCMYRGQDQVAGSVEDGGSTCASHYEARQAIKCL